MRRLTSFLHSRCTIQTNATSWRTSVALGVGIFLFLYLLQPFGISQYRGSIFLMCLGFCLMTIFVQWLCAFFFFKRPSRKDVPITNGYIILYSIAIEFAMAISMTLYAAFFFQMPLTWQLFSTFFYWTFLVWVIVTAIFTLVNYNRMLNSRLEEMIKKTSDEQEGILITLHDQNLRGTDLTLPINNLLYIEARKNNVCVCYIKEGKVVKAELRSTLIALKDDLPYDNIFQCHRSFLVNINNITSAKGNSNGYQLRLLGCEDIIPVSRTFVPGLRHFVG
ncbi:hypothetical protein PMEL1_01383 [Prevotella melaninogenica]|uniref:HTH LytTR-type domain-containing protein n=2 Tax=Prevotella melaninogenica TaxID=28132 RepID=A0A250KK86_9BACT|nr:hypothetical protein PMEL1_01383 [Prevotella melaninogenica]